MSGDEPSRSPDPIQTGDEFFSSVGHDCSDNAGDSKTRGMLATKHNIK